LAGSAPLLVPHEEVAELRAPPRAKLALYRTAAVAAVLLALTALATAALAVPGSEPARDAELQKLPAAERRQHAAHHPGVHGAMLADGTVATPRGPSDTSLLERIDGYTRSRRVTHDRFALDLPAGFDAFIKTRTRLPAPSPATVAAAERAGVRPQAAGSGPAGAPTVTDYQLLHLDAAVTVAFVEGYTPRYADWVQRQLARQAGTGTLRLHGRLAIVRPTSPVAGWGVQWAEADGTMVSVVGYGTSRQAVLDIAAAIERR
jgi:hypothetical protein